MVALMVGSCNSLLLLLCSHIKDPLSELVFNANELHGLTIPPHLEIATPKLLYLLLCQLVLEQVDSLFGYQGSNLLLLLLLYEFVNALSVEWFCRYNGQILAVHLAFEGSVIGFQIRNGFFRSEVIYRLNVQRLPKFRFWFLQFDNWLWRLNQLRELRLYLKLGQCIFLICLNKRHYLTPIRIIY